MTASLLHTTGWKKIGKVLDTLRKVKRPPRQTMTSTWSFTYRHVCRMSAEGRQGWRGRPERMGILYVSRDAVSPPMYPVGHTGVWYRPTACTLPATVATDSRNITAIEPCGILVAIPFSDVNAWANLPWRLGTLLGTRVTLARMIWQFRNAIWRVNLVFEASRATSLTQWHSEDWSLREKEFPVDVDLI